jgi:hypothetical protein
MSIQAFSLLGAAPADYEPPTTAVAPTVKLTVQASGLLPEEGSGFLISEPGWDYIVLTARHVICPAGRVASQVRVRVSTGASLLGAALAFPDGHDDATDCGVVLLWRPLLLTPGPGYGAAPQGDFDAQLAGFRANSSRLESSAPFKAHRMDLVPDLITHPSLGPVYAGFSGGPLLAGGRVVGRHLRGDRALSLLLTQWVGPCVTAAHATLAPPTR